MAFPFIHDTHTHTRRWYSVILLSSFKLCSGVSNHHMQPGNVIPTTAMAIVQAPFTTGAVKMVQHNFNSSGCSWSSSSPRILSLSLSLPSPESVKENSVRQGNYSNVRFPLMRRWVHWQLTSRDGWCLLCCLLIENSPLLWHLHRLLRPRSMLCFLSDIAFVFALLAAWA